MQPYTTGNTAAPGTGYWPQPPLDASDLDIPFGLATDLIVRRLSLDGTASIGSLQRMLKLSYRIVDAICRHLQQQHLVEGRGMSGADYSFGLTTAGRQLGLDRMQVCQYAGPAPVSLAAYREAVLKQRPRLTLNRKRIMGAFDDLVLDSRFLDRLGPALLAQKSLFLYGPTGNGKTSLAERVTRIYDDFVLVPYAVEVDSQIIVLHDPVVHESAGPEAESLTEGLDPRYALCRRPCVIAGGELTQELLELRMDSISKIYAAPLQMKANNGVLVIDDFGRQVMPAHQLLNRWIIPLDRRVDYLALSYGIKFQVPFETMVVFATNIEPRDLADEAFLRRLPNKLYVALPTEVAFAEIFLRVTGRIGLRHEPGSAGALWRLCRERAGRPPSASTVLDICDILTRTQQYEEVERVVTSEDLKNAADTYYGEVTNDQRRDA